MAIPSTASMEGSRTDSKNHNNPNNYLPNFSSFHAASSQIYRNSNAPVEDQCNVQYVSILADKDEIQARLKATMQETVPTIHVLSTPPLHAGDEAARTTKRRRKSDCPSRPKKRNLAKCSLSEMSFPITLDLHQRPHGLMNGHSSHGNTSHPDLHVPPHLPGLILPAKSQNGLPTCSPVSSRSPAKELPTSSFCSNTPSLPAFGDSSFSLGRDSNTMEQLLAAVRVGFGSASPDDPRKPSSLSSTLSPYQSPRQVVSPTGGTLGGGLPSPNHGTSGRLPSIGEFFGSTGSSSHSRVTSPLRCDPVLGLADVHPPCKSAVDRAFLLNGSAVSVKIEPPPEPRLPVKCERKRRSCSIDAANILASVSIPRSCPIPRLPHMSGQDSPRPDTTESYRSVSSPVMPDALPVRASASPYFNPADSSDAAKLADFQTAVASIPPPLRVTIDEQRQSIRLKINTSIWNASSVAEEKTVPVFLPDTPNRGKKTESISQDSETSLVRVKKKVIKFSPEVKTPAKLQPAKAVPVTSKAPAKLAPAPKPRVKIFGTSETSALSKPMAVAVPVKKEPIPRELLADFTTTDSPLAIARFEALDIRAKFDQMPAQVQFEIVQRVPKSWTEATPDGGITLKPGVFSKTDSKFKHHLATWQSNLAAGEYDSEVRRKYIEMAVGNLDPWKVENFEPVYGQLMAGNSVSRFANPGTSKLKDDNPGRRN
ncbi:hypothetical protein BV898_13652 [Hypsibius exemplaris]|uniref:ASX DEUBAD domain-containing protein n=1 Tax=Hypsibius exemplaris TaxID=2072580 RepID=A0A1W0WAA1_HYPEX|nr:hypothetical protein BV898_13652 [Hypsibius exemplaris]